MQISDAMLLSLGLRDIQNHKTAIEYLIDSVKQVVDQVAAQKAEISQLREDLDTLRDQIGDKDNETEEAIARLERGIDHLQDRRIR